MNLVESGSHFQPHGVRWLILARLAVVIICIAVLLVLTLAGPELQLRPIGVYLLLLVLSALSVGYIFLLPVFRSHLVEFMLAQFVVDTLTVTGLVFFTGGVNSNFVNLYFVLILASSLLLARRASGLFASLSTVGLAVVSTLYLTGTGLEFVEPQYHPVGPLNMEAIVMRMLLTVIAFYGVAFLSGFLADRLDMFRSLNEEILQTMAEAVAVFDHENRVAFLNREFEELFASGRPVQLGDGLDAVFPCVEDVPLRRLIESRTASRFELPARESPLEPRPPVEVRTSLLGSESRQRGMVMLAIDLSQRLRAEVAERRAERFSAVSEMAAGLAHEIRNPLASVRGSIQEISRDFEPGTPNQRLSEIVIKESDRLDRIITNFLQYARQRPLRPVNCRLGRLLDEVRVMLESRPDAEGIDIRLELGDNPWLRCDPDHLREVFLNLGVNALAAMEGKGTLTIRYPLKAVRPPDTVRLRKDAGTGVAVSFADTGPGLARGTEERLFEPFYTTKARGSGLGLAIVRRVIESHDGRVWVESEPGQGATFTCWLPLGGPYAPGAPGTGDEAGDPA